MAPSVFRIALPAGIVCAVLYGALHLMAQMCMGSRGGVCAAVSSSPVVAFFYAFCERVYGAVTTLASLAFVGLMGAWRGGHAADLLWGAAVHFFVVAVTALCLAPLVLRLISSLWRKRGTRYILKDARFTTDDGILRRVRKYHEITTISEPVVDQTFWPNLFRCARLTVCLASHVAKKDERVVIIGSKKTILAMEQEIRGSFSAPSHL
jgi:hypothetical protein